MHTAGNWQTLEKTLSQDMATLQAYLQNWKLKFSEAKKMSYVFHLNHKEVELESVVNLNGEPLSFSATPNYLGVTLYRSLTFLQRLESLPSKLISRVSLLQRLAETAGVLAPGPCAQQHFYLCTPPQSTVRTFAAAVFIPF